MASTLSPPAATGAAIGPASQTASGRSGWGRSSAPGSAPRGTSKGRPPARGGRRGPRGGGRSASGKGLPSDHAEDGPPRPNADPAKHGTPSDVLPARNSTLVPSLPPTPSSLPPPPSSLPSRPRTSPRKAPEPRRRPTNGPSEPMTPTTPSSNRPSTRRRRSQNNGKAVPPVAPSKPAPTLAPSFLTHRAEKPTNREPPPHIHVSDVAPAHDVAHDVDALVEHVRSIAMDRPHTPGSYIDWAGDDDDSLPDLDDWGVTSTLTDRTSESSKATTSTKDTMISPILEDTLKPLPSLELSTAATSPASSTKGADESLASVPEASEKTPKVAQAEEPVKPSSDTPAEKEKEKAPRNRRASRTKNGRRDSKSETIDKVVNGTKSQSEAPVAEPVKLRSAEGPSDASPTKPTTHVPTHSSLPPKPVVAAAPRRNSRAGKVDAQSKPSVKESPVESKVPIVVSPPSATKVAVPEERQVTSPPTAPSEGVDRPFSPARSPEADKRSVKSPQSEPGLEASIWAPSSTKSPTPDARQAMSPLGLEASIHAPSSTRSSTPGHTSSHSVPDTRGFLSPNTRSRTQGRRPLHVNGAGDHLDAHSSHAHHSRTHSMPPTGPGTATAHARAVHATRPVITGDAISRLARTLGGAGLGIAKREVAAVSAAKN